MPREKPKIKTRSWVRVDGELVEVKTLPPEMRQRVATALALEFNNTLFAGRVVFYPADEEPIMTGSPGGRSTGKDSEQNGQMRT